VKVNVLDVEKEVLTFDWQMQIIEPRQLEFDKLMKFFLYHKLDEIIGHKLFWKNFTDAIWCS
jgi:hypothetical protein